jgi:hypothetical protein
MTRADNTISPNTLRRSFITEHTVEYYLVPRFLELLHQRYAHALPFYFWKSREGGALSRGTDFPEALRACALFPRRPKIVGREIVMKVNEEVLEMSRILEENDVPVFLGIPLVRSMVDLANDFEILWFRPGSYPHGGDLEVLCPEDGESPVSGLQLYPDSLIHTSLEAISPRTWRAVLEGLSTAHSRKNKMEWIRHQYLYGTAYKPVYFLVW